MAVRNGTVSRAGLASSGLRRLLAAALAIGIFFPTLLDSSLAAPSAPAIETPSSTANIGGGRYSVVASIFAEGTDGQVGTQASSGHWIQPNDNLVALPACTQSSCPWVATGTGVEGRFGPQTTCAESDGLCWVEIVSASTGKCTVAPVHDRGPLFVKDNWWAPQGQRTYNVPQGIPAAEYARDGSNFGYGAGISDVGHDIRNVYRYAAGIDLAAGTWKALGLPVSAGITTVTVTMLWQAGITRDQACGGAGPGTSIPDPGQGSAPVPDTSGNATTSASLNLRSDASLSAGVVAVMPMSSRVEVTGGSRNGFYPVTYRGTSGWAYGQYLRFDSGADPGPADSGNAPAPAPPPSAGNEKATVVGGSLNLRSGAGLNYSVLAVMPNAAEVTLTGQSSGNWLSVSYNGTAGWAFADYLRTATSGASDPEPEPEPDHSPSVTGSATTQAALNMRSGAGIGNSLLLVVPSGVTVSTTANTSNGYTQIVYNGTAGWVLSNYLGSGSNPDSGSDPGSGSTPPPTSPSPTGAGTVIDGALNLRSGAGTGYGVILVMPGGAQVNLLGESSNGFVKVTYNGSTGWAYGTYIQTGGSSSGSNSGSNSASGGTATIFDGALNLRSGPGTGYGVLLVMPNGATVTLTGETSGGFSKVTYNGTTGWAYSGFLS
jgi:uncharacterized protein YraI